MSLKIVVIGGGSSYTPEIMDGIIKRKDELPVSEVVLVDIAEGKEKLMINSALVERMLKKAGLKIKFSYSLDRRSALKNADFVLTQLRVGGLKARANDERIPLKYGLVGQETTGAGGFAKALRTIPVILDICRDIEETAPDAWLINFTNPAGIVTEAVLKYTKVKAIGLCNVPRNMENGIAERLGIDADEIKCRFAGLNHLSFVTNVYKNGVDIIESLLVNNGEKTIVQNIAANEYSDLFIKSLGVLPSPYLQYFYSSGKMVEKELENIKSGKGTRAEQVMKVEAQLFERYKDVELNEKPKELEGRGGAWYSEAAVSLIDAIYNDKNKVAVVNVMNNGAMRELADNCVVETNCIINKEGAKPLVNNPLPAQIRGLIQQVKAYEELTIEAAVEGSKNKALMALVANPLVADAEKAEKILDEILMVNKIYLERFYR